MRHWLGLDEFLRDGLDLTRSAALGMRFADDIARERDRIAAVQLDFAQRGISNVCSNRKFVGHAKLNPV
jgi:hypothetical protein